MAQRTAKAVQVILDRLAAKVFRTRAARGAVADRHHANSYLPHLLRDGRGPHLVWPVASRAVRVVALSVHPRPPVDTPRSSRPACVRAAPPQLSCPGLPLGPCGSSPAPRRGPP